MTKKIKRLFALIICSALILPPVSVKADDSITYLQNQTPDAWSVMALAAVSQNYGSIDFLKSVSGNLATDYAKAILAVTAIGQDPTAFGNIDYVAKLKSYYNNNQFGSDNLVNDDIWSILALRSAGEKTDSSLVNGAKNFIIGNQNVDGGWSYGVGSGSDSNDTAAAIMALLEAGVSSSNTAIVAGIAYLHSAQNSDGGFGYAVGADSDAGSDAWVIAALNKLGLSASAWSVNGHDPINHLQSLQDTDGGYWWVAPGTSDWNNKSMTAYAVVALAGKSFPLGYFTAPDTAPVNGYHLLIQGPSKTICDTTVDGATALDLIAAAADDCNYAFIITDSAYGRYLSGINDNQASGLDGWLYFVNNISPDVGAADYQLKTGDEVIWYYGEWGWLPTRISLDQKQVDVGGSILAKVEYYDGSWHKLSGAKVLVSGALHTADDTGQLSLTFDRPGSYNFFVKTDGYVPSSVTATVGNATQQAVDMGVEIKQGMVLGDSIVFSVTPTDIQFGAMSPGQSADQSVTISNGGSNKLVVSATVSGDSIFTASLKLNGLAPTDFSSNLAASSDESVIATLAIDKNYLGAGVKSGSLIFWATPN